MIRRPPRSTRTDTLLPYTTLFRSVGEQLGGVPIGRGNDRTPQTMRIGERSRRHLRRRQIGRRIDIAHRDMVEQFGAVDVTVDERDMVIEAKLAYPRRQRVALTLALTGQQGGVRSEERRVGKECVSPGRSRWSPAP